MGEWKEIWNDTFAGDVLVVHKNRFPGLSNKTDPLAPFVLGPVLISLTFANLPQTFRASANRAVIS
jgi:hypothetical protein